MSKNINVFESFIDEALREFDVSTIAACESTIDDAIISLESMFGEEVVEKLLANAKAKIDNDCKTVEDCDLYLNKIEAETVKFNEVMEAMRVAAEEFKTGQIDKETFVSRIQSPLQELRNSCEVLKIDNVENVDDEGITDGDVANLRAFIIGVNEILTRKREELSRDLGDDTPGDSETLESFLGYLDDLYIANEGAGKDAFKLKFDARKKEAAMYVKEAKKAVKAGDYSKAITLYKKAKAIYLILSKDAAKLSDNNVVVKKVKTTFEASAARCDSAIEKINAKKVAKESFGFIFESELDDPETGNEEETIELEEIDDIDDIEEEEEEEEESGEEDDALESLLFELEFEHLFR